MEWGLAQAKALQGNIHYRVATLEKKIAEMEAEKTQLIENIKAEQLVVITEKDKHIAHVVEELETARNDLRDAKNRWDIGGCLALNVLDIPMNWFQNPRARREGRRDQVSLPVY